MDLEIQEWKKGKRYDKEYAKRWTSHKFKGPGLRYEVAVSILGGDVVWVNGPFACGAWSDSTIMKRGGILNLLEEGERIETDNGYKHLDPEFCLSKSGARGFASNHKVRERVRARHETVNKRFRNFNIVKAVYRHDLLKHGMVFHAVVTLTQLSIESGEPLFDCSEYTG